MGQTHDTRWTRTGRPVVAEPIARPSSPVLSGLSAMLFLTGGVATYVRPWLTPPLYIVGSVVMLANASVAAGRISTLRTAWPLFTRPLVEIAAAVVVVSAAFCSGYFG